MRKRLLSAVFIVLGPTIMLGQDDPPVIRGTINVILANANGIVALTDSQQTEMTPTGPRPYPEPGQKLFRLDEQTVCTIAGFGSAPVPTLPQFTNSAAAIVQEYKRRQHPGLTFRQKLLSLTSTFEFFLSGIANIRNVASEAGEYYFELIMAGYDVDGTPKLGSVALRVTAGAGLTGGLVFSPIRENLEEETVVKELVYRIGGQRGVAMGILQRPAQFADDPVLRELAPAYTTDKGGSLTVEQMKNLAVTLARRTSLNNPTVGGENQVATLQNGHITSFQQQSFREQPPGLRANLVVGSSWEGAGIQFKDSGLPIFIKNRFLNMQQTLDDAVFLESEFVGTRVRYDGGFTKFDSSNQVRDCVLVVGPHALRGSETVRHLADDYVWKQVIFEGH